MKGRMILINFSFTVFLGCILGCSDRREHEFRRCYSSVVHATEAKVNEHLTHGYDARNIEKLVKGYVERTRFEDINFPFVCYAALKFENLPFPNAHNGDPAKFHFQWGGVFENGVQHSHSTSDICLTFFMLLSNDTVRVFSFERRRNSGNRCGMEGKYFRFLYGYCRLSIWDGHLNDLNKPEEMFVEPYKDVFAVQLEQPFNYDFICNHDAFCLAKEKYFRKKNIFRMVWRTKECMLFLPEVLFDSPREVVQ